MIRQLLSKLFGTGKHYGGSHRRPHRSSDDYGKYDRRPHDPRHNQYGHGHYKKKRSSSGSYSS